MNILYPVHTILKICLSACLYFAFSQTFAQTCTSLSDGSWDPASRWSCGKVPGTTPFMGTNRLDTVVINSAISLNNRTVDLRTTGIRILLIKANESLQFNNASLLLPEDAVIIIEEGGSVTAANNSNNLIRMGDTGILGTGVFQNNNDVWGCSTCYQGNVYGPLSMDQNTSSSSLPVEFLSFEAISMEENTELYWKTASETNNSHFVIERSAQNTIFEEICAVQGAGDSQETISYHAIDASPLPGTAYYRLKQVDYDGKYSYSNITVVHHNTVPKAFIYPNMTTRDTPVQLHSSCGFEQATVQYISTASGHTIREEVLQKGETQLTGYQALKPGMYTTRILIGHQVFSGKMIIH